MAVDRIIQPRISDFSSVNEPFSPLQYPAVVAPTGEPPKKKRGRPSKAEYEIRLAEYAARGEPLPPPRKPKTPKRTTDALVPTANMFTPTSREAGGGEHLLTPTAADAPEADTDSPSKHSEPVTTDRKTRNLALKATALAADQMQASPTNAGEASAQSSVKHTGVETETTSETELHGALLAQMAQIQEHAARVEPELPKSGTRLHEQGGSEQRTWEVYQPPTTT